MNISFAEKKSNYARIAIALEHADYQEKVESQIKQLSKKASIPGFRKGHVPAGMLRKMYGESVKADVVNKLISESLYEFMQKEELQPIGQPMPTEESMALDVIHAQDFTYSFDVALRPEITNLLSTDDKLDLYKVETTDEMVEEMLQGSLKNAGKMVQKDTVAEEDFLTGSIHELEGDLPKEEGVSVPEGAMLLVSYIKDETEKAKFVGTPKNSVVVFNPYKAFAGSKAEIGSLLHIQADQVEELQDKEFSFEIKEIKRHESAELGQEFYDTVFGKDVVKTEEEARQKIREYSEARTLPDTNMKFLDDLKALVRKEKIGSIELADDVIRRWYNSVDQTEEGKDEISDEDFNTLLETLKVQLYLDALGKKHNVEVSEEEVRTFAKELTRNQFAQYGMQGIGEEILEKYSSDMLKKDDTRQRISSSIFDQKIAAEVQKDVTLTEHTVSVEEFNKMVNPQPATEAPKEEE